MLPANVIIWSIYGFYLLLGLFSGAAIGSGIMCLLMRKASGESWAEGRSHCDTCGETLRWVDLIPIISYLANKGRCRHCGAKIPVSCLLSELSFGFAGAVLVADFAIPNVPIVFKAVASAFALLSVWSSTAGVGRKK